MHHLVNYSQIMSPVPLCLEKWGVMTPPPLSSYGSAAPGCGMVKVTVNVDLYSA